MLLGMPNVFRGSAPGALLAGDPTDVPQDARDDIKKLAMLSFRTATKMQRSAKRLLNQLEHRNLFDDKERRYNDPMALQIQYRLRDELIVLEAITPADNEEAMNKSKLKIGVLSAMGALHQATMSEISKVTMNTAKTAIEAQKLMLLAAKMKEGDEDNLTDAELSQ